MRSLQKPSFHVNNVNPKHQRGEGNRLKPRSSLLFIICMADLSSGQASLSSLLSDYCPIDERPHLQCEQFNRLSQLA